MPEGTILLVGEGDFSFAASLLQKQPNDFQTVIATCYKAKGETTSNNQELNMNFVKSCGGLVWTDVDATKLHEHSKIIPLKPSQIRFNFPHIDGKMNMKNNRNLLALFFQSCSKLLKESNNYFAQVVVTMCAGQGGTPADGPFLRRWDDSWKITQLAAEADFLLRKTYPFNPERYAKYNCTGFRKQEKGFRVDGAVVHEFSLGRQVEIDLYGVSPVSPISFNNCGTYLVPTYFANKISKFQTRKSVNYPDVTLTHILQEFEKLNFKTTLKEISPSPIKMDDIEQNHVMIESESSMESESLVDNECYLNLTLLDMFKIKAIEKGVCETITGLVFQNGPINDKFLPVQEHIVLHYQSENDENDLIQIIQQIAKVEIQAISVENFETERLEPTWVKYKSQIDKIPTFNDLPSRTTIFVGSDDNVIGLSTKYQTASTVTNTLGCFSVDKLLQLKFDVSDWRLLWSVENLSTIKSPVEFPLETIHDISFWCCFNEQRTFDEFSFTNCLRNYLGDILKSVTLVEEYKHEGECGTDTNRISRCYRLVYQSCDCVLSKSMTNDIQNRLRSYLEKHYKSIVLR